MDAAQIIFIVITLIAAPYIVCTATHDGGYGKDGFVEIGSEED